VERETDQLLQFVSRSRVCAAIPTRPQGTVFPMSHRPLVAGTTRSGQHFTVDCHSSHKGLFAGILVLVLTIISLILFLVLHSEEQYVQLAVYEVSLCEMCIYLLCTLAVLACMLKIRKLPAGRLLNKRTSTSRSRSTAFKYKAQILERQ